MTSFPTGLPASVTGHYFEVGLYIFRLFGKIIVALNNKILSDICQPQLL